VRAGAGYVRAELDGEKLELDAVTVACDRQTPLF
jgi:hypothetical protein